MNCVWSNSEKQFIRDNAHTMKDEEMVAKLSQMTGRNISLQALRKQRRKLGIIKCQGRGVCKIVGEEEKSGAEDKASCVQPNVAQSVDESTLCE